MESIQNFDFFRLHFDENGSPVNQQELQDLEQRAQSAGATDAIFLAHGFRNSEDDATNLYTRFLTTFRAHVDGAFHGSLGPRKYVVAGVYWPSKPFQEVEDFAGSTEAADPADAQKEAARLTLEDLKAHDANAAQQPRIQRAIELLDQLEGSPNAQDEFVDLVLSLWDGTQLDPTEGADKIRAQDGSALLEKLGTPVILPTAAAGEGGAAAAAPVFVGEAEGGAEGLGSFFVSIFGRVGQFLNLALWYVMKNRSGVVGANGVAQGIRGFKAALPNVKVHLVGHSLGGRLMASCAKALTVAPAVQPDSLTLLEAAFSHYGFSPDNGEGQPGFFRDVVASKVVKGPLVATFSMQDTVVGTVYAIASRLAGDNVKAIGDAGDPFGGIGRNGAQKTAEAVFSPLLKSGTGAYRFAAGKVACLDGSGGLITDHGDVTNPNVTYAFASALAQT